MRRTRETPAAAIQTSVVSIHVRSPTLVVNREVVTVFFLQLFDLFCRKRLRRSRFFPSGKFIGAIGIDPKMLKYSLC